MRRSFDVLFRDAGEQAEIRLAGWGDYPEGRSRQGLWQSVQWQIRTRSGSMSASNLTVPQWQEPSTLMLSTSSKPILHRSIVRDGPDGRNVDPYICH